jgi:hypothetical protein
MFIILGIAETVRAARGGTGGVPFWFGSLCGGGTLILVGTFALWRRTWLSFSLTALGSTAVVIATMWTIILPLVAALLVVLALITALRLSKSANYGLNRGSG